MIAKTDFDTKLKKISDRVASNKTKHLIVENELKKLNTFDAAYFRGKNYFEGNDGVQKTLVFQTMRKYSDLIRNQISSWKLKGLSDQLLKVWNPKTLISKLIKPMHVKFNGDLFYQEQYNAKISGPIVNIYIIYRKSLKTISSSFILKKLFVWCH